MDVFLVEYLLGCWAIISGFDAKPNWFKIAAGIGFLVLAHFKLSIFF